MSPKVSIIIPVFNCEKYLSGCIDSVLEQTYSDIEVLIINDGSTDNSEKIINKYLNVNNKIKYFYQENSGPSEARNLGLYKASGDYIVFIDSDDTIEKDYIKSLCDKIINTNSDLACSGYTDLSRYGIVLHSDFDFGDIITVHQFIEMVCNGTGGVLWGKIFKREIIHKYNLKMDKNIFMSEDLIFVLQYVIQCKKFASIKSHLYNYNRLNNSSISSNISIKYLQNHIKVCEKIEEILKTANLDKIKIKQILTARMQSIVLALIEQQGKNIKNIGIKEAAQNVVNILSVKYVNQYKKNFKSKKLYYKLYIFFLKKGFIKTLIFYGYYSDILKDLKNTFLNKKHMSV
ncbi:glycosyltransferase family 2 protein [Neobacillus cucumis]|uniref:glycosyltransferase family 2 protein n=1 Tax=Neobacillus cucumis TaxID=1740721 RepID=UPI00196309DE|nr:glycosyltransferase family 2 protein [Neobacillus cucumis]MBM7651854.1 glycosyltransferase involved in cell wall biosynthesis [Neobacillus cucumis]